MLDKVLHKDKKKSWLGTAKELENQICCIALAQEAAANYDGGHGVGGTGKGGSVVYYVSSMESTVSAIEISAIGAKAVARLVGQRLGLFESSKSADVGEELKGGLTQKLIAKLKMYFVT